MRNATVDYARLIAAFGIVFFHSNAPGAHLAYAALPFFMMMLIVLSAQSAKRVNFLTFSKIRAARLLEPWILWSSIFAALKILEVLVTGKSLSSEFAAYMLLTGPAIHLWFLPVAFCASLITWVVYHHFRSSHRAILGLIILSLIFVKLEHSYNWQVPLAQWVNILPSVFLGLALVLVLDGPDDVLKKGFGLVAAFASAAWIFGWAEHTYQTILAATALLACIGIRVPETGFSTQAASTSLSIYLCHPLVITILDRSGLVSPNTASFACLACAGAYLIAIAFNKMSASKAGAKALEA